MTKEVRDTLIFLAQKYEVASFTESDPSQFLKWYPSKRTGDVELASFIAALLAFGNRKQFIPKIRLILEDADKAGGIELYIKTEGFKNFSKGVDENKKFYRFYSYKDLNCLFLRLEKILNEYPTLGDFVKNTQQDDELLCRTISRGFEGCKIVPYEKNSANKRVNMFLRWMVRKNSPVDIGLWNWADSSKLIIPLDTHVLFQSKKLGLVEQNATSSLKTAQKITDELKKIWSDDPCKGDFALFGAGVN